MILKNTNLRLIIQRISCNLAKRPVLLPSLVLVGSAIAAISFYSAIPFVIAVLISLICLCFREFKELRFSLCLIIVASIYLGISLHFSFSNFFQENAYDVSFEGRIIEVTQRLDGTFNIVIQSQDYGNISLRVSDGECDFNVGDIYQFTGDLRIPSKPTNPGEFDYGEYLKNQGIGVIYNPTSYELISKSDFGNKVGTLRRFFFGIKSRLAGIFTEENGLVASMFLGDSTLIDDSDQGLFRRVGCSHLLAVSGTHFSGFLAMLPFLFEKFNVNKRKSIGISVLFCMCLGFLTGWTPSVTRAAFMCIVSMISRDSLSGMALSSIAIIIANPFRAVSTGFLMSFSCALSIKMFAFDFSEKLESMGISRNVSGTLSVFLASQIGIIPFWQSTGAYFNVFNLPAQIVETLLATLACMVFVPLVSVAFILGDFVTIPLVLLLKLMRFIAVTVNKVPGFSISSRMLGSFLTWSFCAFLILLLIKPCILKRLLLMPLLALFAVAVGFLLGGISNQPELKMIFIDVGQGDSCLIIAGNYSVLVDAGIYSEGASSVMSVLDYYSIDQVDIACMTHWDKDHAGGIVALYEAGRVKRIVTSFVGESNEVEGFITNNIEDATLADSFLSNVEVINRGDAIKLSDSVTLECISPQRSIDGGNEDSVVFLVKSECFSCLLTGDIGKDTERELITSGVIGECDLIKIGHHGSKYSTSRELIRSTSAAYAVISVGRYNNYGHPSPEVIDLLKDEGVFFFQTQYDGAIIVDVWNDKWDIHKYIR